MKVAIIGSRGIPAKYGAFEVCAERVGAGLVEKGWDVDVYCPSTKTSDRFNHWEGIQLKYSPQPPGPIGTLIYDAISLARASFDRKCRVILLLGYSASPFCILPRIHKTAVVINTNGLEWRRSKWPSYAKLYLKLTEWFATKIANSLVSDSRAIQEYYWDQHKIPSRFIAYGTEFPTPTEGPLEDFYVVVMRMEPENRILEIVQGYQLSHSKKRLAIIGPSTKFFDQWVQPLIQDDPRIVYMGPIYDRELLFNIRQKAFAYIHGHTVGGTNPTLLEAMACRNVIIASRVPFNQEVLLDKGFYFDGPEGLSVAIKELENSPLEELDSIRESHYQRVQKEYTWEGVIEEYHNLLSQLVK